MKFKNKTVIKIFFLLIGSALLFAGISFKLLSMQVRNSSDQIAGQIVEVSKNEITIANKSGEETILILTEQTDVRSNNENLVPGQFIHSFGIRLENGSFESKGIRVVKNP